MALEVATSEIDCPVCGAAALGALCEQCSAPLSEYRAVVAVGRRQWAEVWELFRERRIRDAAARARLASIMYRDSRTRALHGWIAFLDGDLDAAVRLWEEIPAPARALLDLYNRAVQTAQAGGLREAHSVLRQMDVPFRPLIELEAAFSEEGGDTSLGVPSSTSGALPLLGNGGTGPAETRASKQWLRNTAVAAGLILVAAGAGGIGYLGGSIAGSSGDRVATATTERGSKGLPASNTSKLRSYDGGGGGGGHMIAVGSTAAPESLSIAVSFNVGHTAPLTDVLRDLAIRAGPDPRIVWIPAGTRTRRAREWYLLALAADSRGAEGRAAAYYRSALASVGAKSTQYWVDDGLYALILLSRRTAPETASKLARHLLRWHRGSLFDNSVTRSVAAER